MNHIYLIRLVLLKRPGFQSQKYGMPKPNELKREIKKKTGGQTGGQAKIWGAWPTQAPP